MKKLALTFVLFAFISVGAFATPKAENQPAGSEMNYNTQDNKEFEKIELTELPEAVKTAVKENNQEAVIESAEQSVLANGEKLYRVTLQSGTEKMTETYHADGQKYEKHEKHEKYEREE